METFWRLTFDDQVARALIAKHDNAGGFKVVEDRTDEEGNRHRRVEVWANFEMPGFVKKLIGDGSYTEVGRWDRRQLRYVAECTPSVNAKRFSTRYEIVTHPGADASTCEREIITHNTVKLPLGAKAMEAMLEKTQRQGHDHSAAFINEWIRTRL
jgi:hypothetical protein